MTSEGPPNRIKELRQQANLSQHNIAAHIGVSKMTVSELERGLLPFTLKYMRGIAEALGVKPADLLTEEDNPTGLTVFERELIARHRAATDQTRETFVRMTEIILPAYPVDPDPGAPKDV